MVGQQTAGLTALGSETAVQRTIHVWALERTGHSAVCEWIWRALDNAELRNAVQGAPGGWAFNPRGSFPARQGPQRPDDLILDWFNGDLADWPQTRLVAPHAEAIDVLVVRDPFNYAASALEFGVPLRWPLWKQHAREFAGRTAILPRPPIRVDFNRWAVRRGYRRRVADALGLPCAPPTEAGAYSSFLAEKVADPADRNILSRWRRYPAGHPYWQEFDEEVRELSRVIFGYDPSPGLSER